MNRRTIICACGCHNLQRSDLLYTKVNGKNEWRCKNHSKMKKGAQQFAIVRCIDCDKPYVSTLRASTHKKRCTKHQNLHTKKLAKEFREKNKAEEAKEKQPGQGTSIWYREAI